MVNSSAKGGFRWTPVVAAAVVGVLVFGAVAVCPADTSFFLNLFVLGPALLLGSIGLLVYALVRRRRVWVASASLLVLWAIAIFFFVFESKHPFEIRETVRWLLWSQEYKRQVLVQPTQASGDLKHIEWDTSGFVGMTNTAYLVFDPADTLPAVQGAQPATSNGIGCKVRAIRRLEEHWYAVLFFTDQVWGGCNPPDKKLAGNP